MDDGSKAYLANEENKYKARIKGFIDEGVQSNLNGETAVNWSSVKSDYASGAISDSDVHQLYNHQQATIAARKPVAPKVAPTEPSVAADMARQGGAGVVRFGLEESKFLDEVGKWSSDYILPIRALRVGLHQFGTDLPTTNAQPLRDKVEGMLPKAETTAGAVTGGITQFMTGLVGFSKYMKAGKTAIGMASRSAQASAAVSGTGMNPDDSLLVNAFTKLAPELRQQTLSTLISGDAELPQALKRLTAAAEGYGMSWAVDGLLMGVKGIRNMYKATGKNPAELAAKVEAKTAPQAVAQEAPSAIAQTPKVRTAKDLQTLVANREKAIATANGAEQSAKDSAQFADKYVPEKSAGAGQPALTDLERQAALAPVEPKVLPDHAEGWLNAHTAEQHADSVIGQEARGVASHEADSTLHINDPANIKSAEDLASAADGQLAKNARATPEDAAHPMTVEEATAHLQAIKPELEKTNSTIIKVEAGKTINATERQALINELADRTIALKQSAEQAAKAGNKAMLDAGVVSPQGVLDFAKYAEMRGIGDQGVASKLGQLLVGGTKQEVAGSLTGALSTPGILLADDGSMSESDKQSYMDKALVAAMFIVAGRYGAKYLFKGTKGAEVATAKDAAETEAKQVIINSETKVAQSLPESITPLVKTSAIKILPKVQPGKVKALSEALTSGDPVAISNANKEVFNFNHIESTDDVKELIQQTADVFSDETVRATRGVVTHAETESLAADMGTSLDDLKKVYGDTSLLAERFIAAKNLLPAAAERTVELAKQVKALGNADEAAKTAAIIALRKQVMVQTAIQLELKGAQSEIGRALSAMRIQSSTDKLVLNEMSDLIEGFGGRQLNEDFANRLIDVFESGDSASFHRFARGSVLSKSTDVIKAVWYSSVLSGVSTHAANIVGNLITSVEGSWERGLAVTIGKAFGTKGAEHYVAGDFLKGQALGSKVALGLISREFPDASASSVLQAFKTNAPVLDRAGGTKIDSGFTGLPDASAPYAISSTAQGVSSDSLIGKSLDLAGKYVFSVPGRALVAEDEFFKATNYYGELYMQTAAKGRSKGLTGVQLEEYITKEVVEPSVEMRELAIKSAREGTYTSQLGKFGTGVTQAIQNLPGGFLIMPFIRTPSNIMKHFAERLPGIGMLMENNKIMWEAGGLQRDLVIAKQATGALYITGTLGLASQGMITGGGVFDKRKEAEQLGGVQPYSIKVGDTYYSYNRLDPLGFFLGLTADWHEYYAGTASEDDKKTFIAATSTILANFIDSKSYLRSLSSMIDLLNGAAKGQGEFNTAGQKAFGQLVGSFYPSLLAGANKSYADPHVKEFWEWSDKVKERVYSVSSEVYNKRNIFGQEQVLEGGLGPDMASPVYVRTANPSLAAKEISRLNVDVTRPDKKIQGIDLTARQYDQLMAGYGTVKLNGKTLQEALEAKMSSPKWETMSESTQGYDGAKEDFIKRTYGMYSRAVKHVFLKSNPDFVKTLQQNNSNKVLARQGLEIFQIDHHDPYSDHAE